MGKNIKKTYWFKAKHYGWGWYPVTWQGWLVLTVFVVIIGYRSTTMLNIIIVPEFIVYTVILLIVCLLTGEKPRWRWGKK
jgi:uncharacterized membrane protein YhaH (DUF805 family)